MARISIIFFLIVLNLSAFSQWRSHYPEGNLSKKNQEKIDNEKNKKLFDAHFFDALKAKSLEDYKRL